MTKRPAWRLERGATPQPDGATRFAVWAPRVRRLAVVLRGAGAPSREVALERGRDGVFAGVVSDCPPGTEYVYRLDGGHERPDPVSRSQPEGPHGPSRVVATATRSWSDEGWHGLVLEGLVIYELHVGTFTTAATFDGVASRLDALCALGVTAIELMPVAEFPGRRNWGYDGVSLYAPHSAYGGPEGLARLVDAAHARGLGVILDVVYNHLGPEGNYLAEFGPYFTDRHRTPWGEALNFDDAESDEVRRFFVDNARYWISEYHLDGLRLDAVHAIYDFGARHLLEEIGAAVHAEAEALGRTAIVIAESDLNDARIVRPLERGGYALDAQWSDDFHHAVHALLTGERSGYYADFGTLEELARALRDRFAIAGRHSKFRRRRHGAPATDVPRSRFVVSIQNHDQVGNRATGDRFGALLDPDRQRLAAALLLLAPYVPMLFMGEEYGEVRPFLYFVSHGDPDLVEAVRRGRSAEFAAFEWRGDVPDPQSEETYLRSRIDWTARERSPHREILALYEALLAIRRETPGLRPDAAEIDVESHADPGRTGEGWIAIHSALPGAPSCAVFNFSPRARTVTLARAPDGGWHRSISTADATFGGPGIPAEAADGSITLEAFEGALFVSF